MGHCFVRLQGVCKNIENWIITTITNYNNNQTTTNKKATTKNNSNKHKKNNNNKTIYFTHSFVHFSWQTEDWSYLEVFKSTNFILDLNHQIDNVHMRMNFSVAIEEYCRSVWFVLHCIAWKKMKYWCEWILTFQVFII